MRTGILLTTLIIVTGVVLATTQGQTPAKTTDDEQAIRKATEAYSDAFNKSSLDNLMALFAPDAEYINDEGKTTSGRDKIAALFKEQLANLKGHTLRVKVQSVRLIKADVGLQDGTAELTGPAGQSEASQFTAVWVKNDGKWMLSRIHDLPSDASPATESTYEHLKELDWLTGEWTAEDKAKDSVVNVTCRWVKNKNFLEQNHSVKVKGEETISVTQMIGWDPLTGKIESWFFDSHGGHGGGHWTRNGNKWTITASGVVPDGRVGSARNSIEFVDDNSFVWGSHDRMLDGQPLSDADVKFTRKASTP